MVKQSAGGCLGFSMPHPEHLGLSLDGFLLGTLNVRLLYIAKEVLLSLFLALSVISWMSYTSIDSNEFR